MAKPKKKVGKNIDLLEKYSLLIIVANILLYVTYYITL
jgi:hypothetical protein